MPAYVIVEIDVTSPEVYHEYTQLTPATIAAFNGKFIVRGGKYESMEGNWQPNRIVVLEFPTVERAKQWWNSPEYSKAKAIRQKAANTKMIIIEGHEPPI